MLDVRIIMATKHLNTYNEISKALFVVQKHKDRGKEYLINTSKTGRMHKISPIITLHAICTFGVWNQDVTKAYIQRGSLPLNVYVKRTPEHQLPIDQCLKLLKPLHGLSESGDSWVHKHNSFLLKNVYSIKQMKTALSTTPQTNTYKKF